MHLNRDWTMQECEGEGSPLLVHPRSWSACDCGPADLGMRVLSLVHPHVHMACVFSATRSERPIACHRAAGASLPAAARLRAR